MDLMVLINIEKGKETQISADYPKLDDSNFLAGKEMAMKNHENNQTAFR